MSGFRFSFPACVIAGKSRIVAEDILLLRKYAFPEGVRTIDDALTVLALARCCPQQSPEWEAYFIENLTSYLVHGATPAGAIDDAGAARLMQGISVDGVVHSPLELELLLHVMEVAADVPESLSAFALDQLRQALVSQVGAYATIRPASHGVSASDLAYVWRILRGALNRGRLILSPAEVVILKAIDDAARSSDHHPAWREMMALVVTLDRPRETLRSDRWLAVDNLPPLEDEIAA
jgi:hypothetical protein